MVKGEGGFGGWGGEVEVFGGVEEFVVMGLELEVEVVDGVVVVWICGEDGVVLVCGGFGEGVGGGVEFVLGFWWSEVGGVEEVFVVDEVFGFIVIGECEDGVIEVLEVEEGISLVVWIVVGWMCGEEGCEVEEGVGGVGFGDLVGYDEGGVLVVVFEVLVGEEGVVEWVKIEGFGFEVEGVIGGVVKGVLLFLNCGFEGVEFVDGDVEGGVVGGYGVG